MRSRIVALGLAALAWASLAMASVAQAKLIGEFVRYQQFFYYPEVESQHDHTLVRPVENTRRGLKKPFLGLACYVGSITNAVRQIVTPNEPRRSGQRSFKFFGSSQSTRTYAFRTLTFSPA